MLFYDGVTKQKGKSWVPIFFKKSTVCYRYKWMSPIIFRNLSKYVVSWHLYSESTVSRAATINNVTKI